MSWQTDLPIIVRTLVNDLGDQPQYSDERIAQLLAVAAKYVQFDVVFDNVYTVDVPSSSITPDPIDNKDEIFTGLLCLKAACIIDQSTLRTKAATEGIRASLGPANISVLGSLEGIKMVIANGPCATYQELTTNWNIRNASTIKAILSPFVGNKFDPRGMNTENYARFRDFYS